MQRFAVIGLGHFGMVAARELARFGHTVWALDSDPERARVAQEVVDRAMVGSAASVDSLRAVGVEKVDAAVVSLGERMYETTLVTLYLSRLGVPQIIVKAVNEDHGEILTLVGATRVVYPEKEMAVRVARRLSSGSILDFMRVTSGVSVMELAAPAATIGKTLRELDLGKRYGVQVLAIKELIPERVLLVPPAETVIKDSDILVMAGPESSFEKLRVA